MIALNSRLFPLALQGSPAKAGHFNSVAEA